MEWDGDGLRTLGVPEDRAALGTVAAFKALIIPEHLTRWHETVLAVPQDAATMGQHPIGSNIA